MREKVFLSFDRHRTFWLPFLFCFCFFFAGRMRKSSSADSPGEALRSPLLECDYGNDNNRAGNTINVGLPRVSDDGYDALLGSNDNNNDSNNGTNGGSLVKRMSSAAISPGTTTSSALGEEDAVIHRRSTGGKVVKSALSVLTGMVINGPRRVFAGRMSQSGYQPVDDRGRSDIYADMSMASPPQSLEMMDMGNSNGDYAALSSGADLNDDPFGEYHAVDEHSYRTKGAKKKAARSSFKGGKFAADKYAMDKQIQNQRAFEEQMKMEERRVLDQIAHRKSMEDADRKMAERLQAEYQAYTSNTMTLVAVVPEGASGGEIIEAVLQGGSKLRVQVPRGLREGELFRFTAERPQGCKQSIYEVSVPEEVDATGAFNIFLPNGDQITAVAPPGSKPGDNIGVPNDPSPLTISMSTLARHSSQMSANSPQPPRSSMSGAEREAFLAALPDDIRNEVLEEERREEAARAGTQQAANCHPSQNNNGGLIHVRVPHGARTGDIFPVVLPNGAAVNVKVPLHFTPGGVIGIPASLLAPGGAGGTHANNNASAALQRQPSAEQQGRINEAKALLDQDLISAGEFEHARAEILRRS